MEAGLLKLELGDIELVDDEVVNTIFRAAHSIKGSGATLGFSEVADFTHDIEALLEEIRSGERSVTRDAVAVLLECVDCLRGMIKNCSTVEDNDQALIKKLSVELQSLPKHQASINRVEERSGDAGSGETSNTRPTAKSRTWSISFRPYPKLFFTGNDPFRLLRELGELGGLEVQVDTRKLPDFADLDPEECYLAWDAILSGDVEENQIREVFAWVEEDCDLTLTLQKANDEPDETVSTGELGEGGSKQDFSKPPTTAVEDKNISSKPLASGRNQGSVEPKKARTAAAGEIGEGFGEESSSIRVSTDKVDELVNLVGELVITQSILAQAMSNLESDQLAMLTHGLQQLERNTRDLQEQALNIRMLPISFAFQRLPRIVHDINRALDKQVKLKFSGENTELDKTVLEKIGDPLVHLVRNALDHGIEAPDQRRAAGKTENGTIHVRAFYQGGNIVIEVSDDGAGLDAEKILKKAKEQSLVDEDVELTEGQIQNLIFEPGFSTAVEVSNISGRGVGMDVVRRNISELGGQVDVSSRPGQGATFTIKLPLTLAILDGQMVRVGDQVFVIPLLAIVESVKVKEGDIHRVAGEAEIYKYRENCLPVVRLNRVLSVDRGQQALEGNLLVIVDVDGQLVGLSIDDVLGQQQVVIKSLEKNFREVPGVSGATILGDGSVALIIDVPTVIKLSLDQVAA